MEDVVSAIKLGITGELADSVAFQMGSSTAEGGDIVVYKDTLGNISFRVDADAGQFGLGSDVVSERGVNIQVPADLMYGLYIDRSTERPSSNSFGLYINFYTPDVAGASGRQNWVMGFLLRNYYDVIDVNQTLMGIRASVFDYGNFEHWEFALGCTRRIYGLWGQGVYQGHDYSAGDDILNLWGLFFTADSRPYVEKYDGLGTLTSECYGVRALARTNPTITSGNFLEETYGGYFEALGTTEGQQKAYGIYAKASGAQENYAAYLDGDVAIIGKIVSDLSMADDKFIKIGKDSDGTLPSPSADYRGKMIMTEGVTGAADKVCICVKKADDTYGWFDLISGTFVA